MRLIDADILMDIAGQQGHVTIDDILSAPTFAPPPNAPLTLDELREMDGEAVWVEFPWMPLPEPPEAPPCWTDHLMRRFTKTE